MVTRRGATAVCVAILFTVASRADGQCRPPSGSNEAKLLAFYSVPLVFSPMSAPEYLQPGGIRIGAEVAPVPKPSREIRRTGACFTSKDENTDLAPVFGRPRITVGLPYGLAVIGSYLPPITIGDATPNIGSLAISGVRELRMGPWIDRSAVMMRAMTTFGTLKGPITCPRESLHQSSATAPCNGTSPSDDTFRPEMYGLDATLAVSRNDGAIALYGGLGANWLRPRFQVNFTSANGSVDNTRVEVDVTRLSLFTGITGHVRSGLDLTAEVYSFPEDAVTFRLGGSLRLR